MKDEKAKDKVGVGDKPPPPSFNNLIIFDPIWSSLIQFNPILSNLVKFDGSQNWFQYDSRSKWEILPAVLRFA